MAKDTERERITQALATAGEPLSLDEIATRVGLDRNRTSSHLSLLRRRGRVRNRRPRKWVLAPPVR